MSSAKKSARLTTLRLSKMKEAGEKIVMLTAYDYPTAQLLDTSGVEVILVGDSLGSVVQGHENTIPVTVSQMIYHGEMVVRGTAQALVVVVMPFLSYHTGNNEAIRNAGKILKETGCQAVKLEGGTDQATMIEALTKAGIPIMAHCGLCPQHVHQLGGYPVQRDKKQLLADALAAQEAGAFAVVLECIPSPIAKTISEKLTIPTIGIGAGPHCDGQVLVTNDMLGLTNGHVPKFVKAYADLQTEISHAVQLYREEVRCKKFPTEEHSYK